MGSESGLEWGQKCVLTPKKLREIKVGWPLLKFPRMGCGVRVLSLLTTVGLVTHTMWTVRVSPFLPLNRQSTLYLTYTPLKTDKVFLIYKCNKVSSWYFPDFPSFQRRSPSGCFVYILHGASVLILLFWVVLCICWWDRPLSNLSDIQLNFPV